MRNIEGTITHWNFATEKKKPRRVGKSSERSGALKERTDTGRTGQLGKGAQAEHSDERGATY